MVTLVPIEKGFSVSMEVMDMECMTSVFGIMSCHLMLAMRLRQRLWKWSSFRMCLCGMVFIPHTHKTMLVAQRHSTH